MYIDISKHSVKYITVLIEKRMAFIKNKILKEKKDEWYDYEGSQLEMKLCDTSDEYFRLNSAVNDFYKAQ